MVECLSSKWRALSSNPSTEKRKERETCQRKVHPPAPAPAPAPEHPSWLWDKKGVGARLCRWRGWQTQAPLLGLSRVAALHAVIWMQRRWTWPNPANRCASYNHIAGCSRKTTEELHMKNSFTRLWTPGREQNPGSWLIERHLAK